MMAGLNLQELRSGFETAYVDYKIASGETLRPSFISNSVNDGKKVLNAIEEELRRCDEFKISVAFITSGGIAPLLQTFKELGARGIKGTLLTTNYQNFTEPEAIDKLHSLGNIHIKMYDVKAAETGFHTKGYIFRKDELYRIIIGSSNMTQAALATNREWNTSFVSTDKGELAQQIVCEFEELWNSKYSLEYEDFIERYREQYRITKNQKKAALQENPVSLARYRLEPNSMQVSFVSNLRNIVNSGEKRALLISATGTGKTYAAAFAMRELGFKKVLFVVHRTQIVKQAKKSFENVFGSSLNSGYLAGDGDKEKAYAADYVFATIQSLILNDNYKKFGKDYFDCCIFDESHHATSKSYKSLIEYFNPKFTLGMTATPDKRDDNLDGRNVYELFDHNIAYEIRLQKAMEERLLCPFHYFGIQDLSVIGDCSNRDEKLENFRYLASGERVRLISDQAQYFGYSGERVKGLIFCSRIEEAKELSKEFSKLGYKVAALSGSDSEQERAKAIDLLTRDINVDCAEMNSNGIIVYPGEEYLDYIITVDIFSEGVDIVEINQVIMLRPTQSPIVFIQQLGRGLRKADGKEYLIVLDFIANYHNNFMIPIALSGDRTYNKDNIRRYLMEGNKVIKGESTIHFDEISRKRIFAAIDNANFSDLRLIRENYANLKNKLGRIPDLQDFDEYGEMDVLRIFDNSNLGSYYKFLEKYEDEYNITLSKDEAQIVEFISKKFASGKRIQELMILKEILNNRFSGQTVGLFKELDYVMKTQFGKGISKVQKENLVNILTNEFQTGSGKKTYSRCIFIKDNGKGDYCVSDTFNKMLEKEAFYNIIREITDFGISRYQRDYNNTYKDTDLVLYQKYTYEDVCRLLNWKYNCVPLNIGGYKFDEDTRTYPVFINYDKDENINDTIKYEDRFDGNGELIAISKSNRSIESEDVQNFLYATERNIAVHLFVRKNKDDKISKEFYYLGNMIADKNAKEFTMPNTNSKAVEIRWLLDKKVPNDLYQYIVEEDGA